MFINNAYAASEAKPTEGTETVTVQEDQQLPQSPEPVSNNWTSLVPMLLVFAVFYFLLIRPQEKRRRAQQDLVSGVKRGEEVITSSGIFGKVSRVNDSDNTVFVEVAKDVEIKMLKTSITDILNRTKSDTVSKEDKKANK